MFAVSDFVLPRFDEFPKSGDKALVESFDNQHNVDISGSAEFQTLSRKPLMTSNAADQDERFCVLGKMCFEFV
jgi:hypothetical protein